MLCWVSFLSVFLPTRITQDKNKAIASVGGPDDSFPESPMEKKWQVYSENYSEEYLPLQVKKRPTTPQCLRRGDQRSETKGIFTSWFLACRIQGGGTPYPRARQLCGRMGQKAIAPLLQADKGSRMGWRPVGAGARYGRSTRAERRRGVTTPYGVETMTSTHTRRTTVHHRGSAQPLPVGLQPTAGKPRLLGTPGREPGICHAFRGHAAGLFRRKAQDHASRGNVTGRDYFAERHMTRCPGRLLEKAGRDSHAQSAGSDEGLVLSEKPNLGPDGTGCGFSLAATHLCKNWGTGVIDLCAP